MANWTYLPVTVVLILLGWWLLKRRPATPPNSTAPYQYMVQHCEQLLRQQPSAARFRLLVSTHYQARAYALARAASQQFGQVLPAEVSVADQILYAHLHSCLGEARQAVELYTRLLAQPAQLAAIYNNRGYAHNLLEEYALAIPDLNQAIALEPNMAFAYNNRGLAWLRLGLPTEGQADIKRSLQLNPSNAYAHRNMGIYYFEQGNYAEALPHFERAHRLNQEPPQLAHYLQQTRRHLGMDPLPGEVPER